MRMKYYFRDDKAVEVDNGGKDTGTVLDPTKYSYNGKIEFNSEAGTMLGDVIEYVEPVQPEVETPTEVKDLEEV